MNFDVYRNYVVVAECYTISEAAKRLNMAQPALSIQMKNLESEYGVQLIRTKKGSRHIELTKAGEVLYHRLKHLLIEDNLLRQEVQHVTRSEAITLTIGVTPELTYQVGGYIDRFANKNEVRWRVHTAQPKTLALWLKQGKIHIMISSTMQSQRFLYILHGRIESYIFAVAAKGHPLLDSAHYITVATLANEEVCVSSEVKPTLMELCKESGNSLKTYIEADSTSQIIDVAMRTGRIGIVKGCLPTWMESLTNCVPLRHTCLRGDSYIYSYKGYEMSAMEMDFIELLKSDAQLIFGVGGL